MDFGVADVVDPKTTLRAGRAAVRRGWFFGAMAMTITAAVFVGFAPSYYLKQFSVTRSLSVPVHVHGALFTAWILLFLLQTFLIAGHRTALHRRLGFFGGLLAVAMVMSGFTVAVLGGRRATQAGAGGIPGLSPSAVLAIQFTSLLLFSLLISLGLNYRRRGDVHKRLMLLATIALLPPALGRVPVIAARGPAAFFGVTVLFIVAVALYDYWAIKRVHAVTLWGGLFLAASFPGRLAIGSTATWQSFAQRLIG